MRDIAHVLLAEANTDYTLTWAVHGQKVRPTARLDGPSTDSEVRPNQGPYMGAYGPAYRYLILALPFYETLHLLPFITSV